MIFQVSSASAEPVTTLELLTQIVYRVEVASYCGLVDESVARGFRARRDAIIENGNINDNEIEKANANAWKAANAEWQNRGLGGFKNWCRTEGLESARYFKDIDDSEGD
ncbi:MAG: hypothetical protein DHS20C01_03040 [marine bacterium B5-7]|nr:MAG: hypothetical protein DHS20C01_03040 [marine bacterium B5-7]